MRITVTHLQAKVDTLNAMLGHDAPEWNTVGSVRLYRAYGGTGVHRVMNTSGGVTELAPIGTAKEANAFLSGIITALRITREANV
jgi:hypothetical protein